jgi:hypothetical protein
MMYHLDDVLMHNVLPLFNYDNPSRLRLTSSVRSGVDSAANNTARQTAREGSAKVTGVYGAERS